MKQLKLFFYSMVLCSVLSSCKMSLIPNYTTVDKLSRLNSGMSKATVLQTLNNVYPFDIMNGELDGCEVHLYKYKHPNQQTFSNIESKSGLRGGREKYLKEGDAYLVYKNGTLYSAHTSANSDLASLLASIKEVDNVCQNKVAKGCMDPLSINYNPDAMEDDGTCEYCECGSVKNPDYNSSRPKSECNSPCIKSTKETTNKKSCGTCDLIDAIRTSSSNVSLNIDLGKLEAEQAESKNESAKKKVAAKLRK